MGVVSRPRVAAVPLSAVPVRDWVKSYSPTTVAGPAAVRGGRMVPISSTVDCSRTEMYKHTCWPSQFDVEFDQQFSMASKVAIFGTRAIMGHRYRPCLQSSTLCISAQWKLHKTACTVQITTRFQEHKCQQMSCSCSSNKDTASQLATVHLMGWNGSQEQSRG